MQGFALPVSSPGRSLFQRLYPLSSRRFPSQFSPSNRPASVGFFTALRLAAPPLHSPLFARLSYRHGVTGAALRKENYYVPIYPG
ncbi:hypothetical protein ASV31_05535 [Enterobacter hormaechei subsp. hoffmannii]|nr:hypothetical protein SS48_18810 [Enterobacter hormaechei subsp. xiangfangensis]KTH17431.1 hypothetical protein ASV31_05535 [Enterobacter hormaechei subsp. hoffmannii]KTH94442.1 hypothetical protein ASV16_26365 [Enterobacter cloacae subsp. cloacae]KTI79669.1 hypothetical protein ASU97_21985 [Enterobacter hormaechei subsp. steigerwaltii]KZQ65111.1 hypothetical protein A3N62_16540 [Enterobacter kobei]OEH23393.1 hypothetical protein AN659_0222705 [Enterobacter sp. ST121:950178628]